MEKTVAFDGLLMILLLPSCLKCFVKMVCYLEKSLCWEFFYKAYDSNRTKCICMPCAGYTQHICICCFLILCKYTAHTCHFREIIRLPRCQGLVLLGNAYSWNSGKITPASMVVTLWATLSSDTNTRSHPLEKELLFTLCSPSKVL